MSIQRAVRGLLLSALLVATALPSASATPSKKGGFLALTYNVAGLPQGISGSDPQTNSPLIGPLLNAPGGAPPGFAVGLATAIAHRMAEV